MDIATSFKIERQGQQIIRQLQWPAHLLHSEWFHSAPPFRRMNLPTSPCCTMLSLCTDCPSLLHARINKTGSRFAIWILSSTCTHAHVCFPCLNFVHICKTTFAQGGTLAFASIHWPVEFLNKTAECEPSKNCSVRIILTHSIYSICATCFRLQLQLL